MPNELHLFLQNLGMSNGEFLLATVGGYNSKHDLEKVDDAELLKKGFTRKQVTKIRRFLPKFETVVQPLSDQK